MTVHALKSVLLAGAFALGQTLTLAGGDPKVDELVDQVNQRLRHSAIQSVDAQGLVKIKTPDRILQLNIKDVAFNVNTRGDEDRVRVSGDYCIEEFEGRHREGRIHRESFSCHSPVGATESVKALRQIKRLCIDRDPKGRELDQGLKGLPASAPYRRVSEILDFVNDRLTVSTLCSVDSAGILTVNAPEHVYRVDLKRAEFGLNDLSNDPKVRIYGEWCLTRRERHFRDEELSRESFTASGKGPAMDVIIALYHLKTAFSSLDPAAVPSLRNVKDHKRHAYTTIQEAIDYINDRLELSLVMGVDTHGTVTVNAPDHIYHFEIRDAEFRRGQIHRKVWGLFRSAEEHEDENSVAIISRRGLKRFKDSRSHDTSDEQSFQCRSFFDTEETIQAFAFIKNTVKAGKK